MPPRPPRPPRPLGGGPPGPPGPPRPGTAPDDRGRRRQGHRHGLDAGPPLRRIQQIRTPEGASSRVRRGMTGTQSARVREPVTPGVGPHGRDSRSPQRARRGPALRWRKRWCGGGPGDGRRGRRQAVRGRRDGGGRGNARCLETPGPRRPAADAGGAVPREGPGADRHGQRGGAAARTATGGAPGSEGADRWSGAKRSTEQSLLGRAGGPSRPSRCRCRPRRSSTAGVTEQSSRLLEGGGSLASFSLETIDGRLTGRRPGTNSQCPSECEESLLSTPSSSQL